MDSEPAAVKAKSCGDCDTYLKILYQQKGPKGETVTHDLALLVLTPGEETKVLAAAVFTRFCSRRNEDRR